jgi:hypothetical protein
VLAQRTVAKFKRFPAAGISLGTGISEMNFQATAEGYPWTTSMRRFSVTPPKISKK